MKYRQIAIFTNNIEYKNTPKPFRNKLFKKDLPKKSFTKTKSFK